jgi:hypothetical protein
MRFKYMFNVFPTSSIGSENALNMYLNPIIHISILTEDKNSTREGVKKIMR